MERYYDAVIIGAGPAGTACGITLCKKGAKPCLIDKAVFPRRKTCAGLVTDKTCAMIRELFGSEPPEDLFSCQTDEVRLYHRSELLTSAPLCRPVHLVSRSYFDNELVELYRSLGGTILEGARGIKVDHNSKTVTLADGDVIRCDTLVYADGALSMSRRYMGIKNTDLAFGIEAYVPSKLLPCESVDLYFGYLENGYVWVFPHGDTVCIGAANRYQKGEAYRDILNTFLLDKGIDPAQAHCIGAFLPYGKAADQRRLPDDVLLVGDAAGLTDPISGEGLYMALASGARAADAAVHKQKKQTYLKSIEPLLRVVKEGRQAQKAFYSPAFQRVFLSRVKGNSRVVSYFFENMVENYRYSYRSLPRLYRDYKKA